MIPYPFSSPVVLTDVLFVQYGGHTGNSVQAQRTAAYHIAEKAVTEDVGTYLKPVTVTGTFSYDQTCPIRLEHAYINSVNAVFFFNIEEDMYWSVTGTGNCYVSLRNSDYGLVDLHQLMHGCGCGSPYKVQVSYNAGFSSGTAYQPDVLLALTTYADIILNEIIGYGNEAPGDIGVQSFSNQSYSENRISLMHTVYGDSARAQFAHKLLSKYRIYRYVGM